MIVFSGRWGAVFYASLNYCRCSLGFVVWSVHAAVGFLFSGHTPESVRLYGGVCTEGTRMSAVEL